MSNQCTGGHELVEGFAFCPVCGAARASDDSARHDEAASAEYTRGDATPASADVDEVPRLAPHPVLPPAAVRPQGADGRGGAGTEFSLAANKKVLLVGAGALVIVLIGALAFALSGSTHTITGELTLMDQDGYNDAIVGGCEGSGGYDDISYGTSVTVRDGAGEILATGSLESGEELGGFCNFPFSVSDVPDADFYEVEVSHRGGLSYSDEEMNEKNWTVSVSLGDPF